MDLTQAMSHLDDNYKTLDEEFYLVQGRLLAAVQDARSRGRHRVAEPALPGQGS